MPWFWYVLYALAHGVFLLDLILEFKGKTTFSEYVWESPIPPWVWYGGSFVAFNVLFWFVSGPVAAVFLGGWVLGHLAR